MGQTEIIKALALERKCNNNNYLTTKEIEKALKNIGFICRKENISKSIRKIKTLKEIEVTNKDKRTKAYRLKEGYENIYFEK